MTTNRRSQSKSAATRTINSLHFEDLEPHRFEDLIRQVAYTFRTWRYLDATGRLGADGGLDIHGIEVVYSAPEPEESTDEDEPPPQVPTDEREWRIQCKRYKAIGPKLAREIVQEVVTDPANAPYGLIIAAACDFSATAMAAIREEALRRGVRETHIWGKASLEDKLFQPEYDHLLFAYFGISLGAPRQRTRLQDVRARMAIRNKVVRALELGNDVSAMVSKPVIIGDIKDETYPDLSKPPDGICPPWHQATVEHFGIGGVYVWLHTYDGWLLPDEATWDILEESREPPPGGGSLFGFFHGEDWGHKWARREQFEPLVARVPKEEHCAAVREVWGLLFENIVEVDRLGDAGYPAPHLYVRFDGDYGPYTKVSESGPMFYTRGPCTRPSYAQQLSLSPENRQPLFAEAQANLKRGASRLPPSLDKTVPDG